MSWHTNSNQTITANQRVCYESGKKVGGNSQKLKARATEEVTEIKSQQVHKYQIKTIISYVAPPMSTRNATKVKFSQASPELHTFKQNEIVTTVTRSRTETIARCTKSIVKQVRKSRGTKEKEEVTNKPTKRHTAPIPTFNRVDNLSYTQHRILAVVQ